MGRTREEGNRGKWIFELCGLKTKRCVWSKRCIYHFFHISSRLLQATVFNIFVSTICYYGHFKADCGK